MKATLSYDLPDEQEEFTAAEQGSRLQSAIFDFDQKLRSIIKHTDQQTMDVEKVRDMLWEYLRDNNCSIS